MHLRLGSADVDDLRERVVGCLLGLALGDALGAPFEFRKRGESPIRCRPSSCLPGWPIRDVDRRHGDGAEPLAVARRARRPGHRRRTRATPGVVRDRPAGRREPHATRAERDPGRDPGCRSALRGGGDRRSRRERIGDVLRAARSVPSGASRRARRRSPGALRDHALGRALPDGVPRGDAHGRGARRGDPGRRSNTRSPPSPIARATRSSSTSSPRPVRSRRIDGPDRGSRSSPRRSRCRSWAKDSGSRRGSDTSCRWGDTDTNAAVAGALLGARHGRAAPDALAREARRTGCDRSGGQGARSRRPPRSGRRHLRADRRRETPWRGTVGEISTS